MPLPPVLAVVSESGLAEDLARLCAVTGLDLVAAPTLEGCSSAWGNAPLILVSAETPVTVLPVQARRGSVVVLRRDTDADDARAWRTAALLGAGEVLALPTDERRLIDRLADAAEGGTSGGPLIAVASGCGGAGASTLAVSVALALGRSTGDCLLVDADALGGGLDLLLDLHDTSGLRWPDLAATRGRVAAEPLRAALPTVDGVSLLSAGREPVPIESAALASICDAGRRGFGATVVDLGDPARAGAVVEMTDAAAVVVARAETVLIVVPATVRSATAALTRVRVLREAHGRVLLVVRRVRGAEVSAEAIAEAAGIAVAWESGPERSVSPRLVGPRSAGSRLLPLLLPRPDARGRRGRRRIA